MVEACESRKHPPVRGKLVLGRWMGRPTIFTRILSAILQKTLCLPSMLEEAVWPGEISAGPNALTEESVPCVGEVCFA
jgi:hypothetical protein